MQTKHTLRVAATLSLVMCTTLSGCDSGNSARDSDPDVVGGLEPTYLEVQIALHGSGCTEAGCHGRAKNGGLNLLEDARAALVNVQATGCKEKRLLVVPGRPEASYLIDKIRGRRLCDGVRMPLGCDGTPRRPCLSEERMQLLEAWIKKGAPAD